LIVWRAAALRTDGEGPFSAWLHRALGRPPEGVKWD
jgi:hypothetical protein